MPSFVNDENTPVYPPHAGVIHLDGTHAPHYPVKQVPPRPSAPANGRPDDDAFDEFDNSSSHSSDTSDPRARVNGDRDSAPRATMTPLANGAQPSRGLMNGVSPGASGGVHNANVDAKRSQNTPNGRPYATAESQSTESRPMMNGRSSTSSSAPTINIPPQNQYYNIPDGAPPKRGSVESSGRTSLQQTPVDAVSSKPLTNGDRTPRASHDTSSTGLQNSPSNPPTLSATPDPYQQQSQPPHRFSSPPHFQSPGANPSGSASNLQPPNQLKHRHTLEVPKVQSGRGSRDGLADAAYASGRFSPTVAGSSGRRASLSLGRRNTRSLHSEVPRDEVPLDDDAMRWAEAYRQKRAKKKRKEELDDDKVLVGTKVDESHANWTTAYNMLTGIRVSVSRTNAKLDRPLTDADFEAKQKSTFDITGNELVPSAKYDFKFKDYAPWVFRHLRALFRLDPADYLMSLTGKYILSELGSPGKSGSFFYFSRDYKYIIKTIHHAEHKFLRKILKDYYNHVTDNPNTLLSQFYGLHRVKMPWSGKKIHFVVMNNLFPPHRDIHQTFDLKGSTIGRDYKEEDLEKNPRATLKDLNWLRRKRHLEMGLAKKQLFLQQLQRDVRLMQKLQIMDYSLLIGVHDLKKGNEENLRGKTLQVFNPGGDDGADELDPHQVLMRTPSKLESARKARELRQMIKAERPVPMGQSKSPMPEELDENYGRGGIFYSDDGGLRATHEDNTPGEEVYYLGVIDCLTHYGVIKKIEHFWKGLSSDRTQISALPPVEYGERFIKFMAGVTMSPEEAERDQRDREAAAEAAAASEEADVAHHDSQRNSQGAPPVPTYLPPAPPGMRSPKSPEPNPTVEMALRKATKKEKNVAKEDEVPERTITTSSANAQGKGNAHAVLPVVEETAEAASIVSGISARSHGDHASGNRPFTPSLMETPGTMRADGFTDLGPHGIGGRGPPTPPKSSYLDPTARFEGNRGRSDSGASTGKGLRKVISRDSLEKDLPPLPQGH
ncbi:hypothetical protein JX265_007913 [Neoarthrinium moseri]|uniref:1-phosphatidylinositol-4-phosphate 5-kinase n=1 Tax=Neoarthrinium moseri TaxID=1658444 RepID=A0A9P9WIS2_9PEZI|nr:hypothetical protein JX265_007913 [Neoarthrinium moseri]